MANRSSADVGFLLAGGRNLLGTTTLLEENPHEAKLEQTHALGDAWEETSGVGVSQWSLKQTGFYDDAVGAVNEALVSLGRVLVAYALAGNVIGRMAESGFVFVKNYRRIVERGLLHKAEADYVGDGMVNRGLVSAELVARTAVSGNSSTSIDNGAISTAGATLDIELSALNLDGGTNLEIRLEDSADNSAWATVSGMTTTFTTAPNSARLQTAAGATIRRYTRTAYIFNGAPGGARSCTFATVIARSIV